jgi:hypothetical protein
MTKTSTKSRTAICFASSVVIFLLHFYHAAGQSYRDTSVTYGSNVFVLPDAAPVNVNSIHVAAPVNFKGIVSANNNTGVVNITHAGPIGTYLITITSGLISKNFSLTVNNPNCSSGVFSNSSSNFLLNY